VRGGKPAADALRAGENGRSTGGSDAGGPARAVGSPARPAREHDPRSWGGVWPRRLAGADVPALARDLFAGLAEEHAALCRRIAALDRRLRNWRNENAASRRLTAIPGVGRLIASLLVMKAPDPHLFKSGRDFAAWLGPTPRGHATAGKARPGRITRAGDPMLRSLLVVGATAVIWQTRRGANNPSGWLMALLERKPAKLAAVALANKMALRRRQQG
jgi:transposase